MKTLRYSKTQRIADFYNRLSEFGFTYTEIETLRRAQMTLHRWSEMECGDGNDYASWSIERDETTGKPYKCVYPHSGKSYRTPVADLEKGALRRIAAIMANYPHLWFYHQGDPRGCSLYVGRNADVMDGALESLYTRGIAVVI